MRLGERERRTLARVADTFVPDADGATVAARIEDALAAVGRPRLLHELALFLRVIEQPLANIALAGTPRSFGGMTRARRERYLLTWAASAVPLRRSAFQAAKRLSLFFAYAASDDAPNPLWTGIGYERPALDPPAAPALRAREVRDGERIDADAVVVGSGAGGGVAAAELARAGKHVIVLEQGGLHQEGEFLGREASGATDLYWDGQLLATEDLALSVFAGRTVGGGTVVNWSTSLRLPADIRDEWTKAGLDGMGDELDAHYDAVEQRVDVDLDESAVNAQNAALARGLEAAGVTWRVVPRNVKGCGDCGHCGYGCRRGAKQSTMRTFLADALACGTELIADCQATRIGVRRGRVEAVSAVTGDGRRIDLRTPVVVLAGGAIGTPALLLRSGIGGPQVGRSLHVHPVPPVPALYDEPIRIWSGMPQSVMSDAYAWLDGAHGFRLEVPSALPGVLAATFPWGGGTDHRERMRELDHVAVIIPIVRDRESGRVTIDRAGRPLVRYRVRGLAARHCVRAIVESAYVHLAAGAREVFTLHVSPLRLRRGDDLGAFAREVERRGVVPNRLALFSAHQMSTARMARSRRASVADPNGRIWGLRGLYVADASAFPSASGVNPMLTVMALARRNVSRVVAGG